MCKILNDKMIPTIDAFSDTLQNLQKEVYENYFDFTKTTIYNYHTSSNKISEENKIEVTVTDNRSPYIRLRPNMILEPNTTYKVSMKYSGNLEKIKMFISDYTTWGESSNTNTLIFTTTNDVFELSIGIYPKAEIGASLTCWDIKVQKQ